MMSKGNPYCRRPAYTLAVITIICSIFFRSRVYGFTKCAYEYQTESRYQSCDVRARTSLYIVGANICDYDNNNDTYSPVHNMPGHLSRRYAISVGATTALSTLLLSPIAAANALTNKIPTWKLDGGVTFPILALNTAGLSLEETYSAIDFAIDAGITHIDFHPGDERNGMAKYLSKHKETSRESLFLNTKIRKPKPGTSPDVAKQLVHDQINEDLRILNVQYVDMLMLRDSPDPLVIQSQWSAMEEVLKEGKARSIGVINYCPSALKSVLQTAKIKPAVNYIMVHAGMGKDAHGLRTLGEKAGIRTFTYGQTGELPKKINEDILNNSILKKIGGAHGRDTEEVALQWVIQNDMAASIRPSRNFGRCEGEECRMGILKQVQCFDWTMSKKEMAEIDALTSPDDNPTLFSSAGCPGAFGS